MSSIKAIDLARFIIEKTNHNLFLTGKAGTGKTTFLHEISDHTKKKVIVLAPTGVAAVNAHGMTIHSFFQFGFGPYLPGILELEKNFKMTDQKRELIQNLELIIIDEISMVRADLLDRIDNELKRIRSNQNPFGGVQILMIGDLLQLPPIANKEEEEILNQEYESLYFFDSKVLRETDYYCINLDKVFRQKDTRFIELLNRTRDGKVSASDLHLLNSRFNPKFVPKDNANYITLVTHKNQADNINLIEMDKICGKEYIFNSKIIGIFPSDSYPTLPELHLKVGAQVMFVRNNYEQGVYNGTMGKIIQINDSTIIVNVNNNEIVVEPIMWNNIRYSYNKEKHEIVSEIQGTFIQYPIKPSWAITIHKSQGLTFDNVIIDIQYAFSSGQTYVALSRCRSLDGIILRRKIWRNSFITDSVLIDYIKGVPTNLESLASNVNYQYFEYEDTVSSKNIINELKQWRTEKSREQSIPAYCIMYDRTIEEIAEIMPSIEDELSNVRGIGSQKIEDFGREILAIVNKARTTSSNSNPKNAKSQETKKQKNEQRTWELSYQMFCSGMDLTAIALERSLTEDTICKHLIRYIDSGDINPYDLVDYSVVDKIRNYIKKNPNWERLSEIYNDFNETISYTQIRLALKCIERD